MFEVYAQDYRITIQEIPLGNQGEDMARCLVIDITDAVNEFGSGGTVSVRNKRNGDELPYFCTNVSTVTGADAEGNVHTYIKWTLTDVDTAVSGSGFVQADYIISGVTVKTWVYKYFILPSLGITGDVPDPYEDILEEIEAQVSAVQAAAASAAASAAQASAEATRIITTTESVVEDWLSDHIVTGYTVDDTLTISGAAADSKKAGDMIRAAFVTEQTSGSIASFTDGADNVPVKDLVVNITPTQTGTGDPSPTNIRSISGWTAANIYVRGTNLWDEEYLQGYYDSAGRFQSASNQLCTKNSVSVCPNITVRFIIPMTASSTFNIVERDADGGFLRRYSRTYNPSTGYFDFTISSDCYYIDINFSTYYGATYNNDISINYPATDFTYHKYDADSTVYNVSFGSSAGTVYGGTLDVTTGMLTVTHIGRSYDGTENWTWYASSNSVLLASALVGRANLGTNNRIIGICSHVATQSNGELPATIMFADGTNGVALQCKQIGTNFGVTTVSLAGWKAYLGTTPLQLTYELAQPVSYQLTPTEVKTLLGNNNIWSDTGSVASCEYRADTKLYLEKLTTPDDDMVANANITSGSYFMVGNSLYLATANIANGGAITPGTNCTATNLAAALNAINS